jgi:hypothetical protein
MALWPQENPLRDCEVLNLVVVPLPCVGHSDTLSGSQSSKYMPYLISSTEKAVGNILVDC